MATKITNVELAAQVATLTDRIEVLEQDCDVLDRGYVQNGILDARALEAAEAMQSGLTNALAAAGYDQPSYADPVVSRVQARRRRIEQSGLVLLQGGVQ